MAKPFGFSKALRLTAKQEIDRVFRQGRYHRLGLAQAKTLCRESGPSRFLVSVRKSVGPAPARNRIKRVLREAIRLNRHRLRHPHDVCLFVTRRPARPVALAGIEQEIQSLFERLSRDKSRPAG